ncbi:MAG: ATP-dependent DNA helicase [Candidatus Helarchaeota archaeon]
MVTPETLSHIPQFPPSVQEYFPFTPRPGQTLMANEIYYGVLSHNHVAIEGAAGIGKTVTVLSALLPICKEEGLTLLYTARTHSQMQRVIEELNAIQRQKSHAITGICLHGRANMCLNPEIQAAGPVEAMELCNMLKKEHKCDFYENLKSKDVAEATGCFTADYLREFAMDAHICPYYLGKELLPHCDVIALTYMYLISPLIRPTFFKSLKKDVSECIIVFDECHNLPHLTMNTMSLHVSLRGLNRAIREYLRHDATGKYPQILEFLKHFRNYLQEFQSHYGPIKDEAEVGVDKTAVQSHLKQFVDKHSIDLFLFCGVIKSFAWQVKRQLLKMNKNSYSSIAHFGNFLEHLIHTFKEPQYLHYFTLAKNHIQYNIRCIDCRRILAQLQNARSIVSISGTLNPIDAYIDICGFPSCTRRRVLPSPFDPSKVGVFCTRGLDVSFFNRNPARYQALAKRCMEVVRATPGNTAIFTASYEVLEGLQKTFLIKDIKAHKYEVFIEQKVLSSKENERMINEYKTNGHKGRKSVLLGVCGGRNSEGVDFPGVEMLSTIIVGVPLARMSHSIKQLILYYTEQFGFHKGKDYIYTLPALRRANQAAGRPIRWLKDYGVIVLLDDRFTWPHYRRFLSHWINEKMVILKDRDGELEEKVATFYALHTSSTNAVS